MKVVRTGCPRPLVVEIEYSSTAHLQPEKVKPLSAETPPDKAGYGRARHRIAADRQAGSLSPHLAPTVTGMTSSLTGTHPRIGGGAPKTVAAEHTFEQLKARTALMDAIYSSAYFWQMATDERGSSRSSTWAPRRCWAMTRSTWWTGSPRRTSPTPKS